jgi:hypothetical protein
VADAAADDPADEAAEPASQACAAIEKLNKKAAQTNVNCFKIIPPGISDLFLVMNHSASG